MLAHKQVPANVILAFSAIGQATFTKARLS
jgi:hypothetical protein